jgi:hypothetical protein
MVGGKTLLAQQRGAKQRTQPGPVLQHFDVGPGFEQDRGAQHRRRLACVGEHGLPFGEPFLFIPVEIVDQSECSVHHQRVHEPQNRVLET